ncbi:5-methyltetrahydropteroyltriglutamate--homocysteine S-methyltransferase [Amycolatopsis antarctica]|uniref:5-methyltetrahydropteroyltriglutamate--homocysteine methyltransferase n=1 Tax=Amycolatopsis antarctica TaxID=1854586 RepID=A0A263D3E4_9PSEU|nr:5-methyltetrahydropteroyltriglutamate--homocysteine S-methyltransferase [Amycolatopsis antarctica]OZM71875.1 5-methyltetrahydropteroyltriglutamate--homocysteine S-methyltransferase [Amycolatopsis antarctica]
MHGNPVPTPIGATVLGYPRIGARRELKRAVESYWAGRIDAGALQETARDLRAQTWAELRDGGLDSIPGNTFSFYDQVLDTATLFDAVPDRYRALELSELDTYFAMARGRDGVEPLELTKWFDTNYHYLVPEISPGTRFRLAGDKPVAEYREAAALGVRTRPVLLGPVTFLLLAKRAAGAPAGFRPLDTIDQLVERYAELLARLADEGADWVQLDEPAFAADRTDEELATLGRVYDRLTGLPSRPRLLVTGYYGELGAALPVLARTGIEALGVDLVAGASAAGQLAETGGLLDKILVLGVVDGRNVWRTDLRAALRACTALTEVGRELAVSSSCSLLHVPYDLDAETDLPGEVRARLAFARQKVAEIVLLRRALTEGEAALDAHGDTTLPAPGRDETVRSRVGALNHADYDRGAYPDRAQAQRDTLDLPAFPTTTIGSFPQTGEIRRARADLRAGRIDATAYESAMRSEISAVVARQEDYGLDVLVHGEPERNDMVQYFAEQLDGFAATEFGWVQSYGSRCVRPPILHGDVSRPAPITVEWSRYAQSLTERPVKGMLTGPVTILAWSFVRDDQPLGDTATQVALALRDEVADLERAGIRIVQVDEPALRELLPLRQRDRASYVDWSVAAFRLATAGAADATQVHTHLCYSEFADVIQAIDGLDADVTTIEAARSRMEVLADLREAGFARGVGPGVYDIHSPLVPSTADIAELLQSAAGAVPADRLWVNPDCGLKTRGYGEVEPALRSLVAAARSLREQHG